MSGRAREYEAELASTFTSTTGGVMTVEAGAITGDLELRTRPTEGNTIEAVIKYSGARDQYTVTGSPVPPTGQEPHEDTHAQILDRLTTPGRVGASGELPVDLAGLAE